MKWLSVLIAIVVIGLWIGRGLEPRSWGPQTGSRYGAWQ